MTSFLEAISKTVTCYFALLKNVKFGGISMLSLTIVAFIIGLFFVLFLDGDD